VKRGPGDRIVGKSRCEQRRWNRHDGQMGSFTLADILDDEEEENIGMSHLPIPSVIISGAKLLS